MTSEEQVKKWVKGKSIHNTERDECCPDFSCCQPELLAPFEVREKFQDSGEEARFGMLAHFLGAALAGENVHIAGQGASH